MNAGRARDLVVDGEYRAAEDVEPKRLGCQRVRELLNTKSSLTWPLTDGSIWCIMVQKRVRAEKCRFTVTLDPDSYERLKALVARHEPPLTLNYGVQYAVKLLLERAADHQAVFSFADPSRRRTEA